MISGGGDGNNGGCPIGDAGDGIGGGNGGDLLRGEGLGVGKKGLSGEEVEKGH